MAARIGSWEDAGKRALLEAEKRLGAEIEKHWISSIALEPSTHGGLWSVNLDLRVREGRRRKLVKLSMKLNPETGEPIDLRIEE
ncbi:MAG: hypothetical protein QXK09_00040 [Nitrososphaerota archaeon]